MEIVGLEDDHKREVLEHSQEPKEIDPEQQEVTFLALHHLAPSLAPELLRSLESALTQLGLLPDRLDFKGGRHPLSYEELKDKYAHISQSHLVKMASNLRGAMASHPAAPAEVAGVRTLLGRGCFDLTAHRDPQAPRQTLPPANIARKRPIASKLAARETGRLHARGLAALPRLASPELVFGSLRHQRTVRGHLEAVYCCVYNRTGSLIVTGADDCLVKLWSAATGLLLACCPGHEGEITDLSVSCDDQLVASGDTRGGIRVWFLHGDRGDQGSPCCVLQGHDQQISILNFHPSIPGALLSSSLDGTMRLWDVHNPQNPPLLLSNMGPLFGVGIRNLRALGNLGLGMALPENPNPLDGGVGGRNTRQQQQQQQLLPPPNAQQNQGEGAENASRFEVSVCRFDGSGHYMFAAGTDGGIYVWWWEFPMSKQQRREAEGSRAFRDLREPVSGAGNDEFVMVEDGPAGAGPSTAAQDQARRTEGGAGPSSSDAPSGPLHTFHPRPLRQFPVPQEVCRLPAHTKEVVYLAVSHGGTMLASGGADGQLKVWRAGKRKGINGGKRWDEYRAFQLPPCDIPDPMPGKPKKKAPEVPEIYVVSWSCEDRFLVATSSDNQVRVFDVERKELVHVLAGHERQIHVVDCHPSDPRLAVTASYDGYVACWDIVQGRRVDVIDLVRFQPGGGVDAIPVVDGRFAPDGSGLAFSDVAGQLWILATGSSFSYAASQYDQFFHREQRPLVRDAHGNVADQETGLAPACRRGFDALCDFNLVPYDEPYQTDYGRGKLLAQRRNRGAWAGNNAAAVRLMGKSGRFVPPPPTQAIRDVPPVSMAAMWVARALNGSQDDRSIERFVRNALQRLYAGSLLQTSGNERPEAMVLVGHPDLMTAVQRDLSDYAGPSGLMTRGIAGQLQPQPGTFEGALGGRCRTVELDAEIGPGKLRPTDRARNIAGHGRGQRGRGRQRGGQVRGGPNAEEDEEVVVESDGDNPFDEDFRDSGEESSEGLTDLEDSDADSDEFQVNPTRRSARVAAKRGRKRKSRPKQSRYATRASKRRRGSPNYVEDEGDEEEEEEESEEESEGMGIPFSEDEEAGGEGHGRLRPRRHQAPVRSTPKRRANNERGAGRPPRGGSGAGAGPSTVAGSRGKRKAAVRPKKKRYSFKARPLKAYGWLHIESRVPGIYLPQVGDEVSYIAEGHLAFLVSDEARRYRTLEPLPWESVKASVIGLSKEAMESLDQFVELEGQLADEEEGGAGRQQELDELDSEPEADQARRDSGAGAGPSSAASALFRPVERCRVVAIDYTIVPQIRCTAAVLTLELQEGELKGKTFRLVLPPPYTGHAEFVIHVKEFERGKALHAQLSEGDRVYTLIYDPGLQEEGQCHADLAQVYNGTVLEVRRNGNLWNSTYVAWDPEPTKELPEDAPQQAEGRLYGYSLRGGTTKGGIESSTEDKQWQSPWEIYRHVPRAGDEGGTEAERLEAQMQQGAAHLVDLAPAPDEDTRMLHGPLLDALQRVIAHKDSKIFRDPPLPDDAFGWVDWQNPDGSEELLVAYNAVVPLPFGLNLVEARLRNSYYRSLAACMADLQLLVDNTQRFNGPESKISKAAVRFLNQIRKQVEGGGTEGAGAGPSTRRGGRGSHRGMALEEAPAGPEEPSTQPQQHGGRVTRGRLGTLHDAEVGRPGMQLPPPPPMPLFPMSGLSAPGLGHNGGIPLSPVPPPGAPLLPAQVPGAAASRPSAPGRFRLTIGKLLHGANNVGPDSQPPVVNDLPPPGPLHELEDHDYNGGEGLAGPSHFAPHTNGTFGVQNGSLPAVFANDTDEEEEEEDESGRGRRGRGRSRKEVAPAPTHGRGGRAKKRDNDDDYVSGSDFDDEEGDEGDDGSDSDGGRRGRRKGKGGRLSARGKSYRQSKPEVRRSSRANKGRKIQDEDYVEDELEEAEEEEEAPKRRSTRATRGKVDYAAFEDMESDFED